MKAENQPGDSGTKVVVIVSADAEWQPLRELFPNADYRSSPYGQWFSTTLDERGNTKHDPVIFFHGSWGKIAAAASAQYAIDRWQPDLLVNLGTCGGFEGQIERGTIILVEKTVVYDLYEQMGDPEAVYTHYTTEIDLSWLEEPLPMEVRRTLLVSADRDLRPKDLPELKARFGATAGDWESGAIAYVAKRNNVRTLILRGVTDLVGAGGGEAYGDMHLFEEAARGIMRRLVERLPEWIQVASRNATPARR